MAEIIRVQGRLGETIDNPTLEQLQDIVGGYIQAVYLGYGRYLVVNEEGKLMGLPVNLAATALVSGVDVIVGHAVICTKEELD
jgi:hypothetical protein